LDIDDDVDIYKSNHRTYDNPAKITGIQMTEDTQILDHQMMVDMLIKNQ
jgi:hypothetical protein